MDLQKLYFDASGRETRFTYWMYGVLPAFGISIPTFIIAALIASAEDIAVILLLFSPLAAVLLYAITVKRLHDRDKSALWILLYWGAPIIPYILQVFSIVVESDFLGILGLGLSLVGWGVSLWALVDLGCLEGTRGENRYGPALQTPELSSANVPSPHPTCPNCHRVIERTVAQCPHCNYHISRQMKTCPYCGAEILSSAVICRYCKSNLVG